MFKISLSPKPLRRHDDISESVRCRPGPVRAHVAKAHPELGGSDDVTIMDFADQYADEVRRLVRRCFLGSPDDEDATSLLGSKEIGMGRLVLFSEVLVRSSGLEGYRNFRLKAFSFC